MVRTTIAFLSLSLLSTDFRSARADQAQSAADEYRALLAEYEKEGGARIFAKRFLTFAEQHAKDPVAADALLWVVKNVRGRPDATRALELLAQHHVENNKLGSACATIADARSVAAETLLRTLVDKSPHREVQAQACLHLAILLDKEANIVEQLKTSPELAPRMLQYYGKEYGEHLASLDSAKLEKSREQVYTQMAMSFGGVALEDSTMGKLAAQQLFQIRHLSVGKVAPEIQGEDIHGKEFKLSDFRGKVVMLTFWGHW
jgi:hypothetical protein